MAVSDVTARSRAAAPDHHERRRWPGGEQAPEHGIDAEEGGHGHAREDGVGEGVAHEAQAADAPPTCPPPSNASTARTPASQPSRTSSDSKGTVNHDITSSIVRTTPNKLGQERHGAGPEPSCRDEPAPATIRG